MASTRLIRTLLGIASLLSSPMAFADAQDDAIRTRCPAAQAWIDRMHTAHPELSDKGMADEDKGGHFSDPSWRAELHKRAETDADTRNAWIAAGMNQDQGKRVFLMDRENIAWMKPLFTKNGFPTTAQVGRAGVDDAFLLVQHADQDPAFQAAMLPSLTQAAMRGDIPKGDAAMLTDRVLRAQGKPQRYGTQYVMKDGPQAMTPQPTEDPTHVDERRASMDLMPQRDYECALKILYAPGKAAP